MKTIKFLALSTLVIMASCGKGDKQYDASGVFESTEIIVSAKNSGELVSFTAMEGQKVNKGDILGVIDTLQLSLKRTQLRATLQANGSRVLNLNQQTASIKQQIANLQKEKQRFEKLLKQDAATQKQVDDIDYQIEVLQKQLQSSSEQISSSNSSIEGNSASIEAQIAQIEDQIQKSIITSPITGTITNKYIEQGEFAATGKALFKVVDMSIIELRAYITADQLTSIKLNQKVKVFADQGKKERKQYEGTITWISDKTEFTPKTIQTRDERANLVYAIKITVKNDGFIKQGMYGDIKL